MSVDKYKVFVIKLIIFVIIIVSFAIYTKNLFKSEDFKSEDTFKEISRFSLVLDSGFVNRSFTIYTDSVNQDEALRYARTKTHTEGGMTYVHFYNDKKNTPNISNVSTLTPENAYFPSSDYRVLVYQKTPVGKEFLWNWDMSEKIELNPSHY